LNLGAFLEVTARSFGIVTYALVVNPCTGQATGHGIRDFLLDHFGHHFLNGVGDLVGANSAFLEGAARGFGLGVVALAIHITAANLTGRGVRNLLLDHFGHLLGYREGNFFDDVFVHGCGARNHLVDRVGVPNFAGANLVRFLAGGANATNRWLAFAAAGVDAAIADFRPNRVGPAGLAIGFLAAFLDLLGNALHGANLFANLFAAIFVAGFAHIMANVAADFLRVAFLHALANLGANVLIVRFAYRPANRFAAFLDMVLAHLALDLVASDMAMLFVYGLADNFANFFFANLGDFSANLVFARLDVGFHHLLVARVGNILNHAAVHGTGAFLHDVFVATLLHGAVHRFAFVFVTSLGDLFTYGFLNGFIRGVPPFFRYGVIHQLVNHFVLLLTRREASLRVATRLLKNRKTAGAAIRRRGRTGSR